MRDSFQVDFSLCGPNNHEAMRSLDKILRLTYYFSCCGGIAQLARAIGSQSIGQGFESPYLQKPELLDRLWLS